MMIKRNIRFFSQKVFQQKPKIDFVDSAYRYYKESLISEEKIYLNHLQCESIIKTFSKKEDYESMTKLIDLLLDRDELTPVRLGYWDLKVLEFTFKYIKEKNKKISIETYDFLFQKFLNHNGTISSQFIDLIKLNLFETEYLIKYLSMIKDKLQDTDRFLQYIQNIEPKLFDIKAWHFVFETIFKYKADDHSIMSILTFLKNLKIIDIKPYTTLIKYFKDYTNQNQNFNHLGFIEYIEKEVEERKLERDVPYLTSLLTFYIKNNQDKKSRDAIFEILKFETLDIKAITSIIQYFVKLDFEKCYQYFLNHSTEIKNPNIYNPLISLVINKGDKEKSVNLIKYYLQNNEHRLEENALIPIFKFAKIYPKSVDLIRFREIYLEHLKNQVQLPSISFIISLISYLNFQKKKNDFYIVYEFLNQNNYPLDNFYLLFINYADQTKDFEFFTNTFMKDFKKHKSLNETIFIRFQQFFNSNDHKSEDLIQHKKYIENLWNQKNKNF